jgi:hypothetical protein
MLDWLPFMSRFTGHAPPKRDTNIGDAIAYICYRRWGNSFMLAAGSVPPTEANTALQEFHQAAADGRILVWGKRNWSDVFEPIPNDYWRRYRVEWFSLLRGRTITEPALVAVQRGDEYLDLMTSRSQFEDVWPRKRRRMRFRLPWTFRDA